MMTTQPLTGTYPNWTTSGSSTDLHARPVRAPVGPRRQSDGRVPVLFLRLRRRDRLGAVHRSVAGGLTAAQAQATAMVAINYRVLPTDNWNALGRAGGLQRRGRPAPHTRRPAQRARATSHARDLRTAAAPRACSTRAALTVLLALFVLTVTTLLLGAAYVAVTTDSSGTRLNLDQNRAYAAAQAGISQYIYQLNQDPNYWAQLPPERQDRGPQLHRRRLDRVLLLQAAAAPRARRTCSTANPTAAR